MRALRPLALLMALALVLCIVPVAAAQGPAGTWVSGITCVNLSTTDNATIVLDFFPQMNATSALTYTDPTPLPPGGTRNYYTPNTPPGLPAGFLGSAVVSSNAPLSCNVNTQTTGNGTAGAPYRIGTSSGFSPDQTAVTIYAPQVQKLLSGAWSSYIAVQNADSAAAAVTVTYKNRDGSAIPAATEHATIPAGSDQIFYQASNANLPNGFLGAATISADNGTSKLAGIVNLYNNGADYTQSQLLSYNAFGAGANSFYVPRVVRNFYSYNGGVTIQNVGSAPTTVGIDFFFTGLGPIHYTSPSIASGAALALYTPNVAVLAPVDSLGQGQRAGSAIVTAATGGSIVVIVNEDNRGGSGVPVERVGQGASYNAVAVGAQTKNLFFAQVPKMAGGIFSGGIQVANTTSTATTCTITFSGQPAATMSNVSLAANGVIPLFAPNVLNLPDGFNQAVSVSCGQPVIGISNLAVTVGSGKLGDSFGETTGLNQ